MSRVYSQSMTSPVNKTEECAVFEISDAKEAFTLANVSTSGEEYTLSFWVKSSASGNIVIAGTTVTTTTSWEEFVLTYTASGSNLILDFGTAGTYYIYHLQLEVGNMATDWTVAPEDIDMNIDSVRSSVADLAIETDAIRASVSSVSNSLESTRKEFAEFVVKSDEISGTVSSLDTSMKGVLEEFTTFKQSSEDFEVAINKINSDGVNRVVTTTGRFNDEGLIISKTDSSTETHITPDGMTVYGKNANGTLTDLLTTTVKGGVEATDLHAKTYLIVGGRSRFENYGSNRTGCFWIGGD